MNRLTAICAVTAALVASASPALARADGQLDPSFGSGGVALAPAGGGVDDIATGVTVDPAGGIVAAGWENEGGGHYLFTVTRLLADGAVDSSFGTSGATTAAVGTSNEDMASGVAIDSLGRIVLAGSARTASHEKNFGLARFTPTGQLDSSFNGFGVKYTEIGAASSVGSAVAVDSQNRILVAGSSFGGGNELFTIARYLPNGELDSTFGTGGIVATPLVGNDVPEAMALDSQGRIILAGKAIAGGDDFLVARYLPNGELDHSFGQGTGYVRTAPGTSDDTAYGVAVDPQGRVVVAGLSSVNGTEELSAARYQPDGSLDPSFGTGGVTIAPVGPGLEVSGLALDAQGRPLIAGRVEVGPHRDFLLVRLQENGSIDPTFGAGGIVVTPVGTGSSGAEALTIDPAGRIVLAGWAGNGEFALARYIDDSTPPAVAITSGPAEGSFTNDPTPTFGFSSPEASTSFLCGIGTAGSACSAPFTTPPLADGPHTFSVVGADPAGNRSAPASRTFTVDTRPPSITVRGRRVFKTRKKRGRAHFKLSADEPATFSCRVDHRRPGPCGPNVKTPKLKRGKHLLRVTATDRAGNLGQTARHFRIVAARRR
ncbi:MAG TPA: Ig-like domain-containing protein [Solirubrobacterales bacterium]